MTERRIIGRDRELAVIRRALTDTAAGAGGCHVLLGPAGIGKSRLLRAARDTADELGLAVAAREATPHDLAAPLVTLAGALRNCNVPADEFRWLSQQSRSDDGYLLIERLRDSLERFATRRPLVVVIDDAHCMDELSALAVRELVPALASFPIRWIFAGRLDGEIEGPGRQTLSWLRRAGHRPITLDVLDENAVAELCSEMLHAHADHTVLALTSGCGGNPLRVEQLITALDRTGQLLIADRTATVVGADLPSSFVDTVRDILDSLTPETQSLLRAGSALPRPFGIEAAARLMRRDPAELFPLLDEAMTAGLLTEDTDGLAFAHDLVRQAVYSGLPRTVREQLHRDAAQVAREEKRPALEIAEHLLNAGRNGAAEAVDLLRTAAEEVAAAAPATAADLTLTAVGIVTPDDPRRGPLVAQAVGLLASAGRLVEARTLGEEALSSGLDAESEAKLLLGLADAFKHAGQNRTAVRYAERGLDQGGLPDGLQALLHAIRAHALVYVDDLPAADTSGAEADALGRTGGEPAASVFGLAARSLVAQAQGRMDDALRHAAVATNLADEAGGGALHRHPRIWLGSAQTVADRFTEAEQTLRRGRRESERLGTGWAQPLWHYYLASMLTAHGRLDEAAAEADAGLATAEQITANSLAVPLLGVLLRLAVLRGDLGQAKARLSQMQRLADSGVTAAPEDMVWPHALLLRANGECPSGFALLTDICDAMADRCSLIGNDPTAAATLTALALDAGDRPRATVVATAARRLAEANPRSRSASAAAAHAEGLLLGDPALIQAAIDEYRQTPRPLALAAALEDAGELDEALEIVTRCGARGAQRRIEKRRRGGGRTARRAETPSCLPQLTESERQVAHHVAIGLTNIQVAERLFLSRHTVDSHLRRIFGKMDIRRRVELAALVAQECHGHLPRA